ncbi:MAG: hypothetical protein U5L08_10970 [Xanthomonadales bacterium]|nr:hypothetical protein [Xanthomonadales bacterium]
MAALLVSAPAVAYIGPGSGISLLGGLWGVLVAIVLAVGAILIWPIRYMFRRLRRKRGGAAAAETAQPTDSVDSADSAQAERPSKHSE